MHFCFLFVVLAGMFSAGLGWSLNHGVLFFGAGLLLAIFRPEARLPKLWWGLAMGFGLLSLGAFLPAEWFPVPEWRPGLESLRLETGRLLAVQVRPALEGWAVFASTLGVGLWLAMRRVESPRGPALAFAVGVAIYAVVSKLTQEAGETFGFFPNRNHSATLLAMGAMAGLGCLVQAIREKRWAALVLASVATGLCAGAVLGWSESRAGLLLLATGWTAWLACLGRGYLGPHAVKLVALVVLAVVGGFLVSESKVKDRLGASAEEVAAAVRGEDGKAAGSLTDVDFRVPTWLDTLDMIRQVPWTGVGAGQFRYVFPQYRQRTAVAEESRTVHPESDWLWMAAETGVPATLALAALVLVAAGYSLKQGLRGRVRAVRIACLAGALLVAFHGLFDVPGHRVALAWAAAWLFSLSLPPAREQAAESGGGAFPIRGGLPVRIVGVLIAVAGLWLVLADPGRASRPALLAGSDARQAAERLYREDQARMAEALASGARDYQPTDDALERALDRLGDAARIMPLDPALWRMTGTVALQFDDKQALAEQAFAVERALLPKVVSVPLEQARAWGEFDPGRVRELWVEALLRAAEAERRAPGRAPATGRVRQEIRQQAAGKPSLEGMAAELAAEPVIVVPGSGP